jgi:hypothetical protein
LRRRAGVEKKNKASSIQMRAEPMVAPIMRKFRAGPISASHRVPGGGAGRDVRSVDAVDMVWVEKGFGITVG